MNYSKVAMVVTLTLFLAGCRTAQNEESNITYLHQYGVELHRDDFFARGGNGEVVTRQEDGVVVRNCYQNGLLHGLSSYTFAHSDLIAKTCRFEEGSLIEETLNWQSGTPKQKDHIDEDGNIASTGWYEEGTPRFYEKSKNGRLVEGEYFTASFELESSIKNSCGIRTIRDHLGTLETKETYREGLLVAVETFYSNGTPSAQIPYLNGKVDGVKKTFLAGGEPLTVEEWQEGVLHGTLSQYQNGMLVGQIPYCFGQKQGIEKHFSAKTNDIVEEITWVKDCRQGPASQYLEDGKVITTWYFNDVKVSESQYKDKCDGRRFGMG